MYHASFLLYIPLSVLPHTPSSSASAALSLRSLPLCLCTSSRHSLHHTLQSFDNLACETLNGHATLWPGFNSQRSDPWLQYTRRAFYLLSELHPWVRVLNHCTRFTSPLQSWNFKEPAPCWWHLLYNYNYYSHIIIIINDYNNCNYCWIVIIIITRRESDLCSCEVT